MIHLKGHDIEIFFTPDSAIVGSSQAPYRIYLATVPLWALVVDAHLWEEEEDQLKGT